MSPGAIRRLLGLLEAVGRSLGAPLLEPAAAWPPMRAVPMAVGASHGYDEDSST